ncbi:MAG: acyltransferase [Alistipes sp.]|nr:acyltransferase [Alistipes sp.]
MERRIDYVDIAKGIGILLVIMGHIEFNYVPFCGSVHIPLFFILAGFLYDIDKTQDRTYRELTGKRVKRLLVPYLIYNMVLYVKYLLKLVLSHTFTVELGLRGFLGFVYSSALFYKNVPTEENFEGFVFGNGPLWFLTAMAVSSVIFYFIIYFVLKHRFDWKKIILSSVVLCALSFLLCRTLPVYLPWSMEAALLGAVFMLMGMCLRRYHVIERTSKMYGLPVVCLVLFALLHHINGAANLAVQDYGRFMTVYLILGLLGTYIVLWLSFWFTRSKAVSGVLSYVGQNTLIILAFHMTIISMMVSVLEKINFNRLLDWGGFFVIRFVVGLFGCLVLNEILTRFVKFPKRFL